MPASQTSHTRQSRPQIFNVIVWVATGSVGLLVLGFLAAHVHSRVKLLGVFALAFGFLGGWLLGELGRRLAIPKRWWVLVLATLPLALGYGSLLWESHRHYGIQLRKAYAVNPAALLMKSPTLTGNPADSAALLDPIREERELALRRETGYPRYLQQRISMLGTWKTPWPAVFWAVESLLGTLAGVWLFGRHLVAGDGVSDSVSDSSQSNS